MPLYKELRFTIRSLLFEYRLLWKDFDYYMISLHFTFLSTSLASVFYKSSHPTMKNVTLLPSNKWEFHEEKLVTCLDTSHEKKIGTIQVVEWDFLTVFFTMGDMINIPWANTWKLHFIGNFVCISHGRHQGHLEWMVDINDSKLFCAEEVLQFPEFKTITVEVHFKQSECFQFLFNYYCL